MKKHTLRLFSLLLTLVLLLGIVPFAAAVCETGCTDADADLLCDVCSDAVTATESEEPEEPEEPAEPEEPSACPHTDTTITYVPNYDGTHTIEVVCNAIDCGEVIEYDGRICSDMNRDEECDVCHADIPDFADRCEHPERTTVVSPTTVGKHLAQAVCTNPDCAVVIASVVYECTDVNLDSRCDKCGQDMPVASKYTIYCPENGDETSSDSMNMSFTLLGIDADDVSWSFTASGSAAPELSDYTAFGPETTITVTADNGRGVAKVTATAAFDGEEVSQTFYVSFYDRASATVQIKDGMKSFRFTQTKVFSQATGFHADRVENASLYSYMTDGCAARITLHESSRANERVGYVSCKSSGNYQQYDPNNYNNYSINELQYIYFNLLGEGTFKLNYDLYETVSGAPFKTTSGTITIVVGQTGTGEAEIVYRTDGSAVSFKADDFTTYWNEHAASKSEKLNYVKFSIDGRNYGALYLDKSKRGLVSTDYKFIPGYSKNVSGSYDLNGVTYLPDPREDSYTDEIQFIAYGKANSVLRGSVVIVVGGEKLDFTDVELTDWFYGNVQFVVEEGIMNGTSDTTFSPNGTLTRGMVVTMLYRVAGEPFASGNVEFSDVADSAWYANAVHWASANGIVEGMGDGTFAPDAPITREQLATILYRYAKANDMATVSGSTDLADFKDGNSVSSYAETAMKWAVYEKIMQGSDANLNPKNTATRAEAAAMFQRFLKN